MLTTRRSDTADYRCICMVPGKTAGIGWRLRREQKFYHATAIDLSLYYNYNKIYQKQQARSN
jgi:hypothetical protein